MQSTEVTLSIPVRGLRRKRGPERFLVDADGTVRVWDPVAEHFTLCHCLSAADEARIRKAAAES